ncbi:SigmaK-factor processing regulatory protein BofA [uncultured archaeon]|nr:SigmaK-factor processing regulatory protein BofA [uncultured archaeon]
MSALEDQILNAVRILLDYVFKLVDIMISSLQKILLLLGLNSSISHKELITYLLGFIIVAAVMDRALAIFKRAIYNSIAGVIILFLLHYFGVDVPITLFTVVVTVLFGVPGILALLLFYVGGIFPS